jgi:hypothetical protein
MQDMREIQVETFKKGTIHSAFQKARMWLISCKTTLEKMKIYTPLAQELKLELPTLPYTPTRFIHAKYSLAY